MKHHPQIEAYITLLKAYNEHTNIYSKKAYDKLNFHIQDCINIANIIGNKEYDVLDMGSGSGLPSAIVAIINPLNHVYAIESKSKKYKFLSQVKDTLKLTNFFPVCMDINEYISTYTPMPHFVTAKAFAPYEKIQAICKRLSGKNNPLLIVPISAEQQADLPYNIHINTDRIDHGYIYIQEYLK
jgi:16S rRNA (guanine(527)-N(7))-methyltransferase RsmG